MTVSFPLNERYRQILWATIHRYIVTAEPVGSKTLAQEYGLSLSAATIRNVMGRLEKDGLLFQPHISAGRVPSDSGYRCYVDELLTPNTHVGQQAAQTFEKVLTKERGSLEALVQRAAQILAKLSGYIALITVPQTATQRLHHVQLVPVNGEQILLLVVLDGYRTQSILIDAPTLDLPVDTWEAELQALSNFLTHQLRGRSLGELSSLDWRDLDSALAGCADFLAEIIQQLRQQSLPDQAAPMVVQGMSQLLQHPEFSELTQVKTLWQLLENQPEELWPLLFVPVPETSVRVSIGTENPLAPMQGCALVSCVYHQGEAPVGSVGMIGPTRMLYDTVIPLVESTANYLSLALS
ncbi:MAG: heat-inducible transcriptional repressor HrcA [Cyanobacteria bacterium P01_H01_bin.15]